MKSILYLQKNPFYSTPCVVETANGHLIITNKKNEVILNELGSNITAHFVAAWGIKLTTADKKYRLYVNESGFSPSASKEQKEAVRNNAVTMPAVTTSPIDALSGVEAIADSKQLINDWRRAFEELHVKLEN